MVQTQVIKKNCSINEPKMVNCYDYFTNLYNRFFCFVWKIMHGWGAMDFRICLAPKYHGYLISAQNYEFYLHLAQLDILEFKLSHKPSWQCWYYPQGSRESVSPICKNYYEELLNIQMFPFIAQYQWQYITLNQNKFLFKWGWMFLKKMCIKCQQKMFGKKYWILLFCKFIFFN